MTLSDYLAQDGITASKLAAETNSSPSTITRAAKGETMPTKELMQAIYDATNGAVTPNDFYGIAA